MNQSDLDINTESNAGAEKATAVLKEPEDEKGAAVWESNPLKLPEEDWNDFRVGVRASVLKWCRQKLQDIQVRGFPWGEVLLGVATLTAGAVISAVIADVSLNSKRGVWFFVILPPISTRPFRM